MLDCEDRVDATRTYTDNGWQRRSKSREAGETASPRMIFATDATNAQEATRLAGAYVAQICSDDEPSEPLSVESGATCRCPD